MPKLIPNTQCKLGLDSRLLKREFSVLQAQLAWVSGLSSKLSDFPFLSALEARISPRQHDRCFRLATSLLWGGCLCIGGWWAASLASIHPMTVGPSLEVMTIKNMPAIAKCPLGAKLPELGTTDLKLPSAGFIQKLILDWLLPCSHSFPPPPYWPGSMPLAGYVHANPHLSVYFQGLSTRCAFVANGWKSTRVWMVLEVKLLNFPEYRFNHL